MIVRIKTIVFLFGLLIAGTSVVAKAPTPGEQLEYTLKFRGLVTGFVELDIAKLTMVVEPKMARVVNSPAYVTSLQITTEPYRKAEMLYPVRLNYRSWLDARKLHPLVAFKSLKTREHKEALMWFDHNQGEAFNYQFGKSDDKARRRPPLSLKQTTELPDEQWNKLLETHRVAFNGVEALDYISILHRLRTMPLKPGAQHDFSNFNGEEFNAYRIKVNRERVIRAGWNLPAFRVRMWEVDPKSGKTKGDEVDLWLSDDDKRLLVRFYAERAFGAMEGILETGRPLGDEDAGFSEATRSSLESYLGF
jgi:hypothetical protein